MDVDEDNTDLEPKRVNSHYTEPHISGIKKSKEDCDEKESHKRNVNDQNMELQETIEVSTKEEDKDNTNAQNLSLINSKPHSKDLQLSSNLENDNEAPVSPTPSDDSILLDNAELEKDIQSFLGEEVGKLIMDADSDGMKSFKGISKKLDIIVDLNLNGIELNKDNKRKAETSIDDGVCKKPRIVPSCEKKRLVELEIMVKEKLVSAHLPITRKYAAENPAFRERFPDGYCFEIEDLRACPWDSRTTVVFPFIVGLCFRKNILICGDDTSKKTYKRNKGFKGVKQLSANTKSEIPPDVLKVVEVFQELIQNKGRTKNMKKHPDSTTRQTWKNFSIYVNKKQEMMIIFKVFYEHSKIKEVHDLLIDFFKNGAGKSFKIVSIYVTCLYKVNTSDRHCTDLILGEPGFEILDGLKLFHKPDLELWTSLHGLRMLCQGVEELLAPDQQTTVLEVFCGSGELGLYLSKLAGEVLSYDVENMIKATSRSAKHNNVKGIEYISGDPSEELKNLHNVAKFKKIVAVINWHLYLAQTISPVEVMKTIRKTKEICRCVAVLNYKTITQFPLRILCSTKEMKVDPFIPVMMIPVDSMPNVKSTCMVLMLLERMTDVNGKYVPFQGCGRQVVPLVKDAWWNWLREEDETTKQNKIWKIDEFEEDVTRRKMMAEEMHEKRSMEQSQNIPKNKIKGKIATKDVQTNQGSVGVLRMAEKEELSKRNKEIRKEIKKKSRPNPAKRRRVSKFHKFQLEKNDDRQNKMTDATMLKKKMQIATSNMRKRPMARKETQIATSNMRKKTMARKETQVATSNMRKKTMAIQNFGDNLRIEQSKRQQGMPITDEQQWQLQQQGSIIMQKLAEAQIIKHIMEERRLIEEEEKKLMMVVKQRQALEAAEKRLTLKESREMKEKQRWFMEEEQRQLMEEEQRRLMEEEQRRLMEEQLLMERDHRLLVEDKQRQLMEQERKQLEEEKKQLMKEEQRLLLEEEQRQLMEEKWKIQMEKEYRKHMLEDSFSRERILTVTDYHHSSPTASCLQYMGGRYKFTSNINVTKTPNMVHHPDVNWMKKEEKVYGSGLKNSYGAIGNCNATSIDMDQRISSLSKLYGASESPQTIHDSNQKIGNLHGSRQDRFISSDPLGQPGLPSFNSATTLNFYRNLDDLPSFPKARKRLYSEDGDMHRSFAEVGKRNEAVFDNLKSKTFNDGMRSAYGSHSEEKRGVYGKYWERTMDVAGNSKKDLSGNRRDREKIGFGKRDVYGIHKYRERDSYRRHDDRESDSYGIRNDRGRELYGSHDREKDLYGSRGDREEVMYGNQGGRDREFYRNQDNRDRSSYGIHNERGRELHGSFVNREKDSYGKFGDRDKDVYNYSIGTANNAYHF